MNSLELKIPPPVVALVFALAMWLTAQVAPLFVVPFGIRLGASLALVCIAQGISVAGMVGFLRAKTTVNPVKASSASSLVTGGVYRLTRNPMYLGLAITLFAWAVFLASPLAAVWIVLFVLYITRFQIVPEERVLSSLFGAEYGTYLTEVRRWA